MKEEWKPVLGYEADYVASNLGKIACLNYYGVKGRFHVLKQKVFRTGYLYVYLYGKAKLVHRLVYEAFNGKIPDGKEIDHDDGNRLNNKLDNLFARTHKENCNNPVSVERNSKTRKGIKKTKEHIEKVAKAIKKPILQYTKNMKLVMEWDGAVDVENKLGISRCHISSCCRGKRKTSGGFIWKYKEVG